MSDTNHLLVKPKKFSTNETFQLESGEKLNGFDLVYETYGQLNQKNRMLF